jgi:hypothetical protein
LSEFLSCRVRFAGGLGRGRNTPLDRPPSPPEVSGSIVDGTDELPFSMSIVVALRFRLRILADALSGLKAQGRARSFESRLASCPKIE